MAQSRNLGERVVNTTPWFTLSLADVELPDGRHLDHYLPRQKPVAVTAVVDDADRVLMLWRHRFIPDSWGWELPSGVAEDGERIEDVAARETLEETGWRPGPLQHLATLGTSGGFSDARHHIYRADGAPYTGPPVDAFESDRIEWVPLTKIPDLIAAGDVVAANTIAGLLLLRRTRGL